MINEIEKQFFQCFGIEPKTFYDLVRLKEDTNLKYDVRCVANWQGETKEETIRRFSPRGWKVLECKDVYIYPQITDHISLELLVIMTRYTDIIDSFGNVQELKEFVLEELMYSLTQPECDIVKQQVRTLFEEV